MMNGVKLGLERIQGLMHQLNDPQDKLKFIHVAGTNGKGSTCAFFASMLAANGYKVGMYTSPAVMDVREQYTINGEWIASLGLDTSNLIVLFVAFAVLVAVDIYKYREKQEEAPRLVLEKIASKPLLVSWAIFMLLFIAVLVFGMYGLGYDSGAFIYARI